MFQNNKSTIELASAIIVSAALIGLGVFFIYPAISADAQVPNGTQQQSIADEQNIVAIQKTDVSVLDPCIPETCSYIQKGNLGHQLVMALPPRTDGKIWVGTVTWTASKPIEILVFQEYNSSVTADSAHGKPLTAPVGNGEVAVSLVKTSSGTPIPSGSYPFVGNGLAFHTLGGDKFTITYTVAAKAWELNSSSLQTES
ncbi:MAG TPA: hypothetical protein VJP58_06575 [Candidatus Nitrosocosmicus sp.]|nr:hypothetical protein [Candidatus Nitrosocosmicus sp.]